MTNSKNMLIFGYLGLLASIMVGIGEFLVHFPPKVLKMKSPTVIF